MVFLLNLLSTTQSYFTEQNGLSIYAVELFFVLVAVMLLLFYLIFHIKSLFSGISKKHLVLKTYLAHIPTDSIRVPAYIG